MNIDKEICARAMDKAGEEPITTTEWAESPAGTRVRLIKDVYHATILEALSGTDWTSQKTRAQLELSENDNLTEYSYAYTLPIDCAKPCGLLSEDVYLVEGNTLYTDCADAVLIYVSNKYTGTYKYTYEVADPQPTSTTFVSNTYYILEDEEYVLATEYDSTKTYYTKEQVTEDYYFYDDYSFDPLLSEYIETQLAQKIVLKLTGDLNKYQLLYNEARLMENRAIKASVAHGHNKDKGNAYWGEQLGLPSYGGN